jgi:hypothetical protein
MWALVVQQGASGARYDQLPNRAALCRSLFFQFPVNGNWDVHAYPDRFWLHWQIISNGQVMEPFGEVILRVAHSLRFSAKGADFFILEKASSVSYNLLEEDTAPMPAPLVRATKAPITALTYALLGALVFWTPNVVVHWIIAYRFSGYVVMGLTFLLPAITILFFRVLSRPSPKRQSRLSQALFAVLGIWIAGPAMLTFSSSFCGGGLTQPDAWRFFVYGTLLFPVFTLVMSAYDGTFFALLLTTVLLPVLVNFRFKEAVPRYQ